MNQDNIYGTEEDKVYTSRDSRAVDEKIKEIVFMLAHRSYSEGFTQASSGDGSMLVNIHVAIKPLKDAAIEEMSALLASEREKAVREFFEWFCWVQHSFLSKADVEKVCAEYREYLSKQSGGTE